MPFARLHTGLMVVDGGRVVEEESHQELLALGGTYARLYNIQFAQ